MDPVSSTERSIQPLRNLQRRSLSKSSSLPVLHSKLRPQDRLQLEKDLLEDLERSEWRWMQRRAAQDFSTNVSKISRNSQRNSFQNLKQKQLLERKCAVDNQKLQTSRHISHCRAIAQEHERAQVHSTSNRNRMLLQSLARMEDRTISRHKSHEGFLLSKSSSTLFHVEMPEQASGEWESLKQRLHSMQLTEYAAEKQRALRQARKALAVSHLVEVDIREEELPTARRRERLSAELWQAFLDKVGDDIEMLLPLSNSAPAAIRFFSDQRCKRLRNCK